MTDKARAAEPEAGTSVENAEGNGRESGARRSGRNDVFTYLVIVIAVVLVGLGTDPIFGSEPNRRAGPGAAAGEVRDGDCFNDPGGELGSESLIETLEVVSCDSPHAFEAFAVVKHPGGSSAAYPPSPQLSASAETGCMTEFSSYVGVNWFESGYDVLAIIPAAEGWEAGDRTSQCVLRRLDGELSQGSARSAGSVVPSGHLSLYLLEEGDCFVFTDWLGYGVKVSCADPHDAEIYAVVTSPADQDADYSSYDEHVQYGQDTCRREFGRRVRPVEGTELVGGPLALPTPGTWALGQRSYSCALGAFDGSRLEGSLLGAVSQFEVLVADEFQDAEISYSPFRDDGLRLVGSAARQSDHLVLTRFAEHRERGVPFQQEAPQRGTAWFGDKVDVTSGFRTAFLFQIEHYSWFTIGDGIAFVIQGEGPDELGRGMGYNGIRNSLAVEFDTVTEVWLQDPPNRVPEAPDLLGNHVAVHTRGTEPNDLHNDASLGSAQLDPVLLSDRAAHVALIVYEPGDLKIYVDDLTTPVLTVDVDLAAILDLDDGRAYVGFGASSGPHSYLGATTYTISGHEIQGWVFSSDR